MIKMGKTSSTAKNQKKRKEEKKKEEELKWEKPTPEFIRKEKKAYTSEEVEKRKRTEKMPLISQKEIQIKPWKPLNITKKQWKKLEKPTKRQLRNKMYQALHKQLRKGVKRRIRKPTEEITIKDVEKNLKEIVGENVSENTVLSVAKELEIEGASSRSWRKAMEEYTEIAKGAETIEEVKEKLKKEDRDVKELTALNIASKMGIEGAGAKGWEKSMSRKKSKNSEVINEALEKGATLTEIKTYIPASEDTIKKGAKKYAEKLEETLGKQKTKRILKEEKGFTEKQIKKMME